MRPVRQTRSRHLRTGRRYDLRLERGSRDSPHVQEFLGGMCTACRVDSWVFFTGCRRSLRLVRACTITLPSTISLHLPHSRLCCGWLYDRVNGIEGNQHLARDSITNHDGQFHVISDASTEKIFTCELGAREDIRETGQQAPSGYQSHNLRERKLP